MAQYTAFVLCIYVRWILRRQLENDKSLFDLKNVGMLCVLHYKYLATVCACKIRRYVLLISKLVLIRDCKMIHILRNCFKINLWIYVLSEHVYWCILSTYIIKVVWNFPGHKRVVSGKSLRVSDVYIKCLWTYVWMYTFQFNSKRVFAIASWSEGACEG